MLQHSTWAPKHIINQHDKTCGQLQAFKFCSHHITAHTFMIHTLQQQQMLSLDQYTYNHITRANTYRACTFLMGCWFKVTELSFVLWTLSYRFKGPPPPYTYTHTHTYTNITYRQQWYWLFTDALHNSWSNVVLVVGLEALQEFHVTQQLLGWPPVILNDLAHAAGVRLTICLDRQHDAHRLHHQFDCRGRVLGNEIVRVNLPCSMQITANCRLLQCYCDWAATVDCGVGIKSGMGGGVSRRTKQQSMLCPMQREAYLGLISNNRQGGGGSQGEQNNSGYFVSTQDAALLGYL